MTKWEALRDLRVVAEAALEVAEATSATGAPTPENAEAVGERFAAMVSSAFRNALDAGASCEEALAVLGGAEAAAAINSVMAATVAELRHEDEAARRASAAEAALRAARRRALRGLRLVAAARASDDGGHVATVVAVRDAVEAGIPFDVAMEILERADVPGTVALGAALADARARAADPDAGVVRLAIPLPAPAGDHRESVAADAEGHPRPASPTPEPAPHADESGADLRAFDAAAAAIGATFTERERRIAARAVNHLRNLAGHMTERAERHRRSLGRGRILRRPRASRACHRTAQRGAVALTRDGPPPSDDVPAPVASGAPHGAGGSR